MARITVKEVRNAYKRLGVKPTKRAWTRAKSCCPLSALALADGTVEWDSEACENWAYRTYPKKYTSGFVQGVDKWKKLTFQQKKWKNDELFREGMRDGARVARALGLR